MAVKHTETILSCIIAKTLLQESQRRDELNRHIALRLVQLLFYTLQAGSLKHMHVPEEGNY